MIYNYDDGNLVPEDQQQGVPDFENEYVSAKSFLQKCSTLTGDNLQVNSSIDPNLT